MSTHKQLPDFVIIGSQKAGTTSLYEVLRAHPEIFMPEKKELNFFFGEAEFAQGLDHYARYFEPAPEGALRGEASPGYICHPQGAARVHAALPGARLILTVRNPIGRAYSQYWDNRRQLSEFRPWQRVVEQDCFSPYVPGKKGYMARGTYAPYLRTWRETFGEDRVHVVVFDDLKADPAGTLAGIYRFLGVDPELGGEPSRQANPAAVYTNPLYRALFARPELSGRLPRVVRALARRGPQRAWKYPPMSAAARAQLVAFFQPHNAELEALLGRSLNWDR
jgi:hypothetical protein